MKLKPYYLSLDSDGKSQLAKRLKTSKVYLYQLAYGRRRPDWKYAIRIETATDGRVTRYELRPDIFGKAA